MRAKQVAGIEGSVGLGDGISEGVRTGFTGMSLAGGMRFIGGVGWVLCVLMCGWRKMLRYRVERWGSGRWSGRVGLVGWEKVELDMDGLLLKPHGLGAGGLVDHVEREAGLET